MESTAEEQLDFLLSVASDYNRPGFMQDGDPQQIVHMQSELEEILEQHNTLQDNMDPMDQQIQGRELSADEIKRILDLPPYAIEDIRSRQQLEGTWNRQDPTWSQQDPAWSRQDPTWSQQDTSWQNNHGNNVPNFRGPAGGRLLSDEDPLMGPVHDLLEAAINSQIMDMDEQNGQTYQNMSPESGISSSYDVVSPGSSFQNSNSSPYNGVSPRNGISPPNGISISQHNGVSIVLGSPSTGSTLLGPHGINGNGNGVGIGLGRSLTDYGSSYNGSVEGTSPLNRALMFGSSPLDSNLQGEMYSVSPQQIMLTPSQRAATSSQREASPIEIQTQYDSPQGAVSPQQIMEQHDSSQIAIQSQHDSSQIAVQSPMLAGNPRNGNNMYTVYMPTTNSATTTVTQQQQQQQQPLIIESDSMNPSGYVVQPVNQQQQQQQQRSNSTDSFNAGSLTDPEWFQQKPELSGFSLPGSISFNQINQDVKPSKGVIIPRRTSSTDASLRRTSSTESAATTKELTPLTTAKRGGSVRSISADSTTPDMLSSPPSFTRVNDKTGQTEYFCAVCGDKAGKHSYYGGQVCASCRAFFRRSVQTKYYELFACKKVENCVVDVKTRKTCQFCRFKKCLNNGMKVSWVLSDEERNRRFNKFNKSGASKQEAQNTAVQRFNPNKTSLIAQPTLNFTMEEFNVLDDILRKYDVCKDTFVHNIITMSKRAVTSLIENAYDLKNMEYQEFQCLMKTLNLILTNTVMPQFSEMNTFSYVDRTVLMKNQTIRIWKAQLCINTDDEVPQETECKQEIPDPDDEAVNKKGDGLPSQCLEKTPSCPMKKHVRHMSLDKSLMNSLGLEEKLAKLNIIDKCPKLPKYSSLYRTNWSGGDAKAELRHKELTVKITCWPVVNKQMDPKLIALMTTILMFNVDFTELADRANVERAQLKYLLLLQRYLKSILPAKAANEKFLEAMFLLSYTKELRELEDLHVNKSKIIC